LNLVVAVVIFAGLMHILCAASLCACVCVSK